MCPPIGLRPSAPAKSALAPGSLWTWLVKSTATLNSGYGQYAIRRKVGRYHTLGDVCQLRQELVELLLAFIELTTTGIIDTEEGHDAVDDEKPILIAHKKLGHLIQEFHLMLGVDGASIGDVVLGCMPSAKCA